MKALWVTLAALSYGACAGLVPWGDGGPEPTRATAGAVVVTFDEAALARASTRLGEALHTRWPDGAPLPSTPSQAGPLIDWRGWRLAPDAVTVAFARPAMDALVDSPAELEVRVGLAAGPHEIGLTLPGLAEPCPVAVTVADAELAIPAALTADKLGRVQGVVLPGASLRGSTPLQSNATFKVDLARCAVTAEPGALLAAIEGAFAGAATAAFTDGLVSALPEALRLELAFTWSGAMANDALGTGFVRTSLRGLVPGLVHAAPGRLEVALALGVEAEAHPCMRGLVLPAPGAAQPHDALPAGAAMDVASLERWVGAAWLGGAACADHLGRAPVAIGVDTWPELARLADAPVATSLEVWPSSLPRLAVEPTGDGELVLETGRTRVDVIVAWRGARWRAASAVVELTVHGRLWVEADGALVFDPSRVDVVPTFVEAGLLAAPDPSMVQALLAPLVEALVLDRPLARLPAGLAGEGPVSVDGDYLTWSTD